MVLEAEHAKQHGNGSILHHRRDDIMAGAGASRSKHTAQQDARGQGGPYQLICSSSLIRANQEPTRSALVPFKGDATVV